MSDGRARARRATAAAAEVGWVVAHHALPGWMLAALSSPLRLPLLVASLSALLGVVAVAAAAVHLAVRLSPEVAVPVLLAALALGPASRLAVGATPPLVVSLDAVAGLLRTLDLGGARGWGALAAVAPLLPSSSVVAGAASVSLSTAGDGRAVAVLAAAAAGIAGAMAVAAIGGGRPLLRGAGARLGAVLAAGVAAWAAIAAGSLERAAPSAELAAAWAAIAASQPLVLAIAAAPALWIATQLLAQDARPLERLAREVVSCGAPSAAVAATLAVAVLAIGVAAAPLSSALAALAGSGAERPWAAAAIGWYVAVAASTVVLLEPGAERLAVRALAFAMLLAAPCLVATGGLAAAWLLLPGTALVAVAVAATLGRPR